MLKETKCQVQVHMEQIRNNLEPAT